MVKAKDLRLLCEAIEKMNNKFGWRECTSKERLALLSGKELPNGVYKITDTGKIKDNYKDGLDRFGIRLWFADDEVISVIFAWRNGELVSADTYDITV